MKEQERISKRKASGLRKMENKRWLKSTGDLKAMKAEKSQGSKLKAIDHKKQDLIEQLSNLYVPEIIIPKFSLSSADIGDRTLISISNGSISYIAGDPILSNINLLLSSKGRLAITGDNGSGKSTLAKAILGDPAVMKTGDWYVPKPQNIFYLDQHYCSLIASKSVLESISELVPSWSHAEVRRYLNDFLFRKNEEINALVSQLSGGEKARLSLAQIAAKMSQLLILDEITNNLDLETRWYVVSVLKKYPGAMIVISHDEDFLRDIEVCEYYDCNTGI
jgi:ATPase subunit of ABC transporter with duplicated ATPase domains